MVKNDYLELTLQKAATASPDPDLYVQDICGIKLLMIEVKNEMFCTKNDLWMLL